MASFYDKDDNVLWSKEVFLGHRDSRGYNFDYHEFDEGPPPPQFLLEGERLQPVTTLLYRLISLDCV